VALRDLQGVGAARGEAVHLAQHVDGRRQADQQIDEPDEKQHPLGSADRAPGVAERVPEEHQKNRP
jgi:hypothetical protein